MAETQQHVDRVPETAARSHTQSGTNAHTGAL